MRNFKNGYKWSRDYKRLKQLLDDGYEVVCLVDYDFWRDKKHPMSRDICRARKFDTDGRSEHDYYAFTSRGQGYGDIYMENDFSEYCAAWNVEFIDIDKEACDD